MDETKAFLIGCVAFFVAACVFAAIIVANARQDGADRRDHRLAVVQECVELDDPLTQLACVKDTLAGAR
jgi:uncharacterized membrane protein YhhN